MTGYGHGDGTDLDFIDPIRGQRCVLVVPEGSRIFPSPGEPKIGIEHPNCDQLADVSPDLDCFYCQTCQWNGRVSGAWVFDVIEGTVEQ